MPMWNRMSPDEFRSPNNAKVLADHDVTFTGATPNILGSGGTATAYAVEWKGQPAVLKTSSRERDRKRVLELMELRDALPARFRGHVMVVYDSFDIEAPHCGMFHCVVVERLEPIDRATRDALWNEREMIIGVWGPRAVDVFRDDPVALRDTLDVALDDVFKGLATVHDMSGLFGEAPKGLDDGVVRAQAVEAAARALERSKRGSAVAILDAVTAGQSSITKELGLPPDDPFIDELTKLWYNNVQEEMNDLGATNVRFPRDVDKDTSATMWARRRLKKYPPEAKKFLSFLRWLRDSELYDWDDIHDENVMLRPSTGEWVLSDPGLFTAVKERGQ